MEVEEEEETCSARSARRDCCVASASAEVLLHAPNKICPKTE